MTEKHLIKWFETWGRSEYRNWLVKGRNVSVCDAGKVRNTCSHNEFRRGASEQLSFLQEIKNLYRKYPQRGRQGGYRRLSAKLSLARARPGHQKGEVSHGLCRPSRACPVFRQGRSGELALLPTLGVRFYDGRPGFKAGLTPDPHTSLTRKRRKASHPLAILAFACASGWYECDHHPRHFFEINQKITISLIGVSLCPH
jgi:hypothetical protein